MAESQPAAPANPTGTRFQTDLGTAPTAASEAPAAPAAPNTANPAAAAPAPSAAETPQAADATPAPDSAPQPGAPTAQVSTASANDTAAAETAPESAAPGAEAPVVSTPGSGDSLAIPAAPDSAAPATAFLVNHEPQVYGEENADARIVLKANQDAWVQVRDRQGTLLLTRVLRVGDTYRVPNQQDLTLLTGNAGGLEISVDGRALAPLGPVGAVRRNIPLDPQALVSGEGR
jgi:cytoskeleton protein RodZ